MSLLDFSDTPSRGKGTPRKPLRLMIGIGAIAGVVALSSTLAASINLNDGAPVEFGQGIAQTTACSNGDSLTITPMSSFVNSDDAAFYFTGLTVSDIPESCEGVDFVISAYGATGDALPIFSETNTIATVYNNAGTFEEGIQSTGTTVNSGDGEFTVTFNSPVALSANVMRVTLQSSKHTYWVRTSIASGNSHNCAVLITGAVKCWGSNEFGQVGSGLAGEGRYVSTPSTVPDLSGVSAIASGSSDHSCAVLNTGDVRCWGNNNFGQVGNGEAGEGVYVSTPFTVPGLSDVKAMSVGAQFSCALLNTGAVKCWGRGAHIGDGTSSNRLTPVDVVGLSSGVIAIASGSYHTCAVLNTGAVKCWGQDGRGAVGNGGGGDSPGTITDLSASAIGITGGDRHTCAVLSTGGVQCWGWNDLGQIGVTPGDNSNPQTVSGISSAVALSAGGQTSCALLSSGAVKCWGAGANGQRGNGTTTDSHIPVTVSGLSSAISISNGYNHACALISSGAARCWGSNGGRQLGDGTTDNSLTPVIVLGLP